MTNVTEQKLSLTQLAHQQNVSISAVWRWAQRGVRGVKLETFLVGGRRFTNPTFFSEFVDATTRAADGGLPLPQPRTNRQRESSIAAAERELSKLGV